MSMNQMQSQSASRDIPVEIDRWNWGAFLLTWIWGLGNNTFIALLMFVPFVNVVMWFLLGAKGSVWAWRNGRWDDVAHFKRVQRKWALWGFGIWGAGVLVMFATIGGVFYWLSGSDAYKLAVTYVQANDTATEALGKPITAGFPSGSINTSPTSGTAARTFSVSGPKAAGQVAATAYKDLGGWKLDGVQLRVDGREGVIDLLKPPRADLGRYRVLAAAP